MNPPRPLVLALMGLPGAGKSTLARTLAAALDLHVVDRDALRAAMFPRCEFTMAEKLAALRMVLAAVQVNCALGRSSIMDGMTFSRRSDLEQLDEVVRGYPVDTIALYLDCPPELARARIRADLAAAEGADVALAAKPHPAGDRSPQLVDTVMVRFDAPPATAVVLDARLPPDALAAQALEAIRARCSG